MGEILKEKGKREKVKGRKGERKTQSEKCKMWKDPGVAFGRQNLVALGVSPVVLVVRKRLRLNQLAEWEMRIGDFRVFYDIVEKDLVVRIVAVGNKLGNQLFVHGERYDL